MFVGQAAERHGIHRCFQANTVQSKRVLSLLFLGKNVIQVEMDKTFLVRDYFLSIKKLKDKSLCLYNFFMGITQPRPLLLKGEVLNRLNSLAAVLGQ